MGLTERQIQRYSRQILLKEVGGKGQELLASRSVLVAGGGAVLSVAATYLLAGGTPVKLGPGVRLEGFLDGVSLEDFNPDTGPASEPSLVLSMAPTGLLVPAEVVVGTGLAFRGPDGCRACFEVAAGEVGRPDLGPSGAVVTWGALAALAAQRLLLGQGEALGVVLPTDGLPRSRAPARCPRHR